MSDAAKRRRPFPTWTQLVWAYIGFLFALGLLVASMFSTHHDHYHYQSSDGGFDDVEIPENGRTFEMIEELFADYRSTHGPDVVLYRTSELEPLPWWKSSDEKASYAAHPRWKLPYRPPTGR